MYVKPADGLNVPDPERGGLLAAAGRKVDPTTYWHKRVQCGDVVVVADADAPAAEAAAVQTSAQSAVKSGRADK